MKKINIEYFELEYLLGLISSKYMHNTLTDFLDLITDQDHLHVSLDLINIATKVFKNRTRG